MNTLFIQDINVNSYLNTSTYGFHNVNEMDTPIAENVLTILLLFCTCKYTCFVENVSTCKCINQLVVLF